MEANLSVQPNSHKRKLAFMFPGQGSETAFDGQDLSVKSPAAKRVFEQAADILGWSVDDYFHNQPSQAPATRVQPALLTISVATCQVLSLEEGIEPVVCLGHSLGEYSALVAAGALDFGKALACVAKRAEFMAAAMPPDSGGMAAVLCLDRSKVEEICKLAAQDDVLEVANLNAPQQIVVSGHLKAIERAEPEFKKAGARRVIRLKVSAAFHSKLMRPAAEELSKVLAAVSFTKPRCPVLSNVTGLPHQENHTISGRLVKQVVSPVRWEDCLRWALGQGVSRFAELGPGTVLTGLARRIDDTTQCFPVNGFESIRKLTKSLRTERQS